MKYLGTLIDENKWANRITEILKIDKPIIQAGMIWTSGWRLASEVSKHGGLGVIGAGSMYPNVLETHLQKIKESTDKPFAVNLPLLYPDINQHLDLIIKYKVPIVITSAGSPSKFTSLLHNHGITVGHVVSNLKFALKCQEAKVDFIIAEGFEAGGHNGREETTTMTLIPYIRNNIDMPLVAAGGIGTGSAMLAAMILGAEGVQIGSRFVCSEEASCHISFKKAVIQATEGDTSLQLKKITPVRLLHNHFAKQIIQMESECASTEELSKYLGRGRAKQGIFEGDMTEGELEIGQISMMIENILPAKQILDEIWTDFTNNIRYISTIS